MRTKISRGDFLDVVSVSLVAAGVLMWIGAIYTLKGESGQLVQVNVLLNALGFLFLASQLTTIGVAFYAYSLRRSADTK